jgi:hypothetical protein
MRTAIHLSLVAAACTLAAPAPSFAQTADIKAVVLKDWNDVKSLIVKIAAEMPEDKYGFKPTPPQRNYGEQVLHIAGANINFIKAMGGKAVAPSVNLKATSKAEIIKAVEASFDYGAATINEFTSDQMLEQVKVPPFMGGMASRARLAYFLLGHTWDTYGQMVVYLRLSGGVPPASQRP